MDHTLDDAMRLALGSSADIRQLTLSLNDRVRQEKGDFLVFGHSVLPVLIEELSGILKNSFKRLKIHKSDGFSWLKLDEENMEGFVRILDMVKGYFKTVLLISHLDSLKDCVDMQINIEQRDGYAYVNV